MATKGNINLQLNINTQFTNVKSAVDAFQKQLSNIKIDANFNNSKGLADNFSKQADQIKAKLQELNNFDFNSRSSKDYANLLSDIKTQYAQLSAAVNDYKVSLEKEKSEVQDKLKTEQENLQTLKEKSKAEKEYIDGFQAYHKALAEAKAQNRELTDDEKLLVATYSSETRTMKQLKEDHKNTNQAKRESQAEIKKLQAANKSYTDLLKTESNVQTRIKTAIETTTAARQDEYTAAKNQEAANKSNAAQLQKQAEAQNKQAEAIRKAAEEEKKAQQIWQQASSTFVDDFQKAASGSDELTTALDRQITKWTSLGFIVATAKRAISDIVQTYQELDDNLSAISAVSGIATDQLWGDMPQMIDNANNLALSIDNLTNGMLLFYQQGLSTEETEIRLNAAGKMAAISQQDLATAVDQLTSTMNAFGMEGDDAANVVDVFANMAGKTATDVEELATAMARTASIAKNAGMSFEQTTAFIATMEETTRLSAETIGNSMKSIIARFQKLKTDPDSLLEDGVNANDVEKALKKADVALRDTEGNFRNIGDVIMELSAKWDTLDTNTQKYIATMAAGTQQSSNFIALVGNHSSNVANLAYAMDSAGAAEQQFSAVSNNISSALTCLDNNWTKLKTSFSDGRNVIVDVVDVFSNFVGFLADIGPGAITASAGIALLTTKIVLGTIATQKRYATEKLLSVVATSSLSANKKKLALDALLEAQQKKLNKAQAENLLLAQGIPPADAATIAGSYGVATANGIQTFSWEALKLQIYKVIEALWLFIANPVGATITAIAAALGIAIGAWSLYKNSLKETAKETQNEIDKLKESIAAHKEAQKTYEQDAQSLDDYVNKLREAKENGEDLTDIKNEIAEAFTDEQDVVIACQGSYENLIDTLEDTIKKKKELAQQEAYQALKEESQNRKNEKIQLEKEWKNKGTAGSESSFKTVYKDSSGKEVNLNDYARQDIQVGSSYLSGSTTRKETNTELAKRLGFTAETIWIIEDNAGNKLFEGTEEQYNAKIKELTANFYSANDVANTMLQTGFSAESAGSKLSNQQYSQTLSLVSQFANSDFLEDGQITEKAQQEVAEIEKYYDEIIAGLGVSQEDFLAFLRGDMSELSRETVDILTNQFNQDFGDIISTNDPSAALMSSVQQNIKKGFDDAVLALTDQGVISQEQAEKLGYSAVQTLKTALDTGGAEFASSISNSLQEIINNATSEIEPDELLEISNALQDGLANIDWSTGDGISEFLEQLTQLETAFPELTSQLENIREAFGESKIAALALNDAYNQTANATEFFTTATGDGFDSFSAMQAAAEAAGLSLADLNYYLDEATGHWMMASDEAANYAQQIYNADTAQANALLSSAAMKNSLLEEVTGMNSAAMAAEGLSAAQITAAMQTLSAKKASAQAAVDEAQTEYDAAMSSVSSAEASAQASSDKVDTASANANEMVKLTEEEIQKIAEQYPDAAAALGIGQTANGGIGLHSGKNLVTKAQKDIIEAALKLSKAKESLSDINNAQVVLDAYSKNLFGAKKGVDGLSKASSGGGSGGGGAAEASNELTDALEAQKKALQEQEKALEKSKQALEDQKKALEDQKKALEETNKKLQENYKLYVELIKSRLNDEIDRQTTRIEAFYGAIKDTIQSEIDSFNDQLDALKKQADELKSKADELQDAADQQEDSLNKLYNAAKAYYDAAQDGLDNQIDAYDRVIDRNKEHIDLLNEQKDAIQDQIDALDTAADSESKLLALEKARDALANVRNQKTRMVLTNGGGWRLRTDKSEISNAQSNLASAQRDYQKEILERQQKKIEEQTDEIEKQNDNLENIKSDLEDQKDALDDIKDQWDKAQDALGKTTSELEEQTNLIRQFQYGNDASRQDQLSNFSGQVSNNNQQQQAASDATNRANEASNKYDQQSNEDVQGSIAEAIKKLEEQQNQADEALKKYFENQLSNNAETAQIQQEMKDLINQMVNGQIGQLENFAQFYETINGALEQANTNASQTADYINNINAAIDRYDEWSNRLDMTTDEINQRQAIMNEINNATLGSLLEGGSTFGQLQGQYEQIVRNNDEAEKIQDQIDGLDEQANIIQAQIDALKEQENKIAEQEKELSNANSNKTANAAKAAGNTAASGAKTAGLGIQANADKNTNRMVSALDGLNSKIEQSMKQAAADAAAKVVENSSKGFSTLREAVGGPFGKSGSGSKGTQIGFSQGGVDDFTKTVAIHGTKNRPELVLNNSQSAALFKYIDSMTRIPTLSSAGSARNALMGFGTTNNTNNNGTNFTNCEFNVESNADNLDSLVQDLKQSASIRR